MEADIFVMQSIISVHDQVFKCNMIIFEKLIMNWANVFKNSGFSYRFALKRSTWDPSSLFNVVPFVLIVESESEPEDTAAQVLRSLLHPVRWCHPASGGDEQCAATCDEDALQVRPEGFLLQTACQPQGACQTFTDFQRPGLSGNARGPVLWPRHLQRPDEDFAEGLSGVLAQEILYLFTQ